jgi:hypothetical protein
VIEPSLLGTSYSDCEEDEGGNAMLCGSLRSECSLRSGGLPPRFRLQVKGGLPTNAGVAHISVRMTSEIKVQP